jgi:competence/damage-inducible protein CinA-like protein
MRAEVVGVGTELLLGQIANTNARWISDRLASIGVDVVYHQVVGDNAERIEGVLRLALDRAEVVVVTGGLGPTQDDITRDVLARLMGAPMERDPEIEAFLYERFAAFRSGPMPRSNLRQADVPRGARTIWPSGTAPGLIAEFDRGPRMYALPGVPSEMIAMMESTVLPELAALAGAGVVRSRVLRSTGIGESRVAELVADLFEASTNPSVAFLASAGEVKVRVTAKATDIRTAEAMIAPVVAEVRGRLGDPVFTDHDETLEEAVGRLLTAAGRSLACAESLTGGGVAARITAVPGASGYFRGSAVVYTPEAKQALLGVSAATLAEPGVVSAACAMEMAAGARSVFGADVAIALTGVAGPEPHGGAEPGTVWLALHAEGVAHARGYVAPGDRPRVRRLAEQAALDLVRRYLEGAPLPTGDLV